jgi:hypothetical protein
MSITTTAVGNSNTTVYTSSNSSAITDLTLCNYSASNVTVSLHVVPSGDTAGNGNVMLDTLTIGAHDTYVLYGGSEKLLLDNSDFISVICSATTSVTAIASYTAI